MSHVMGEDVLRCRVTWGEHVDDHLCVVAHAHARWLRVADVVLATKDGTAERVLTELPGCSVVVEPGEGGNALWCRSETMIVAGDALPLGSLAHAFLAWGVRAEALPRALADVPLSSVEYEEGRTGVAVSHRHGDQPVRLLWRALGRRVPEPR